MYTREEASQLRKKFWTSFGQYMRPVSSASGESINWLNYKTGIRNFYFRMDAGKEYASVGIELVHPDPLQRAHYYSLLQQVGALLEEETGEKWSWLPEFTDEDGHTISRIGTRVNGVSVFRTGDWPAIISFLKPRIMALDRFWTQVKDLFEHQ